MSNGPIARTPLRWRIVVITVVLLALGLAISGIAAISVLRSTLIHQIDNQLAEAVKEPRWLPDHAGNGPGGPTQFAFKITGPALSYQETPQQHGAGPSFAACEAGDEGKAMTTVASDGVNWRCLTVEIADKQTGTDVGVLTVALPLTDARNTLEGMGKSIALFGGLILLLGGTGAYFAARRALAPLRGIEGTAARIAAGDLTERVEPHPEGTEVGSLSASLNSMLGQIESSFDARKRSEARMRQFVADASHELRTPLAAMRGYGELYRMGAITGKEATDDTMRRIESSATRMGTLVDDLLGLARLDERAPLHFADVDLATLAQDAAGDARAIDHQRTVTVAALDGTEVAPVLVQADAAKLRQVATNLVSNVLSHTPSSAALTISVGRVGDDGIFQVRDEGPGIEPEHQERVFERFYRVDPSRSRERGGAGLGMAIVDAIVRAHHGSVTLESAVGEGTTVRVRIPLVAAE